MLTLEDFRSGQCPLCRQHAHCDFDAERLHQHGIVATPIRVTCDRCGRFSISYEAALEVEQCQVGIAMSGIAREWTEFGRNLDISKDNLLSLVNLAPSTFRMKREKFLEVLIEKFPRFSELCYINPHVDYSLCHVGSPNEYAFLRQSMLDEGLITAARMDNGREFFQIKAKGWELAEAIERSPAFKEKAFVAMWFNAQVQPAYHDGIAPAISETGYRPIRIDLQEHSDSVIDRIIAEIKEARFVVADFTGQRGGVYFEAGFARGLGLNVIWTCKDDHLDQLHFDVRGFNVIVWKSPKDLRERLNTRIRAVVGHGPLYEPLHYLNRSSVE